MAYNVTRKINIRNCRGFLSHTCMEDPSRVGLRSTVYLYAILLMNGKKYKEFLE